MHTYVVKAVIVGEPSVGKSSLALRAENPKAVVPKHHSPTIGVDLTTAVVTIPDPLATDGSSVSVKLQMWDTAGQERYSIITRTYYTNARMAWMVYDCSRPATLKALQDRWLDELVTHSKHITHLCVIVIGNKADLAPQRSAGDTRLLLELLEQIQQHTGRPTPHIRVSAMRDASLLPLMEMATRECLSDPATREASTPSYAIQRMTLGSTRPVTSCCHIS